MKGGEGVGGGWGFGGVGGVGYVTKIKVFKFSLWKPGIMRQWNLKRVVRVCFGFSWLRLRSDGT